ncbi:hypothetical protein Poli38472_006510 [Pythium oligandrum]|uniref:Uncharacterized protein n=1 Tax=Pythium oligandrum TaxID=41045 RepID=A0A8K1C4X3_PYTOL|nr:hypothetical protein Poli38472_006510 [Pythium oligandrum]|eukprot:TMW56500.1 hypothetical protein Poli38472_006510 [Pythium oligandrum]
MIMSRAFGELMAGTFITFSLAFLVGTVVNNSEGCRTVIDGSFCQQGGVTQSIDTTSSTSNGQCQSVDVGKTTGAAVLTTVLTKVVSIAGSYAESMAKDDAKRKSMLLGGRLLATLALLGFGIGYSYAIASSTGDKEMANRCFETIGIVLGPSWAADQVTDMISVWAQRVGIYFVQCTPKQTMGIKAEQAAGSIVRPVERPLEPPQLDTMVHETDIQVTTAHN